MKRKLFIGSSSEGYNIALQLKEQIERACGEWLEAVTWVDGGIFSLNQNALNSLVKAARKFDYGVLVATKDDTVNSRGNETAAPRDNVMLEMGMFLGSLGLTRAYMLVEEETKLPSDYYGVTVPSFKRDMAGSLEGAVKKIVEAFNKTKSSYNLKPMPSVALAVGYFDNFIQPIAKKLQHDNIKFKLNILLPNKIKDIGTIRKKYQNDNPSTEKSIYDPGTRPTVFELDSTPGQYWDIPTTLGTLNKVIDMMLPSQEFGVDLEKQDWIEHELRTFSGTLQFLIDDCAACQGNVHVLYLS